MKSKNLLAAVLCTSLLSISVLPAEAAQVPTQKAGKTEDGISYTLHYPKVYGVINATIDVLNGSWGGDGLPHTVNVELPVVASGDPFVLELTGGMTGARCPDCGSSCIHVFIGNGAYQINGNYATQPDTFEWYTYTGAQPGKTANTIEIDDKTDSVGLRELTDITMDPNDHFTYTPGYLYYDEGGSNSPAGAFFQLDVGYYLRLPEETIDRMDFNRTYSTKDLEALIQGQAEATYGQSTVKIKGYTIDKDYVGKMLIEVTNNGDAPDKGDLFYVTYSKFINKTDIIDAGSYVPNDLILQIQYEVDANSTKTLEVPMGFLPEDNNLTEDQMEHGWSHAENIESSRTVLAQAETPEEAAELTAFFKAAHDYGEMGLTYAPDSNGVTVLAKPMSTTQRARYLDQKLAAFTSQF